MDVGVGEFGSLTMVQRTLTTLWGRTVTLKASRPSSVVRAVDKELLTFTAFTRGLLGTRVGRSRLPTHAPNAPLSRNV